MTIYGRIELPLKIEEAYRHLLESVRKDEGAKITIKDEVGDLGKGTIIEQEYAHRGKKQVFKTVITENIRPHTLNQASVGADIEVSYDIHLKELGDHTLLESQTTFHLKFNFQSFKLLLFSTRYIRARHYWDIVWWGSLFQNKKLKTKYWCRIWGVTNHAVTTPLWVGLFYIIFLFVGYLNPDLSASEDASPTGEEHLQTEE
ncbi:hypothetical protein [Bdellovibrio sp. HCB337]|uniref:hypothetical protein n=1 Tax=Bdellovibrio sp. HCB337 TaxID=3394358 RepID=UPI0039A5ACFC